jgi:hypothetical protein
MKALSVRPEYTFDIFVGEQTFEERTWKTDHRGDLLICASSKKEPGYVNGYAYFVIPLLDIRPSEESWFDESGKPVTMYEWVLGKPRAIEPIPVKGKLHLYDVDDALIHYVDGGDLGAYATQEEANAFIDDYIRKYLDPLAYNPNKSHKSGISIKHKDITPLPILTEEEIEAMHSAAMMDYESIIKRIALIREWLGLGVFWDSISDPVESANLGPLPDVCGLYWEELDKLLVELEGLEDDLRDNEPARGTPAHRVWTALMKQVCSYADAVSDFLAEVEMDAEEEAFNNRDKT